MFLVPGASVVLHRSPKLLKKRSWTADRDTLSGDASLWIATTLLLQQQPHMKIMCVQLSGIERNQIGIFESDI